MKKMIENVSVSGMSAYQACPLRWCFSDVENRVPRGSAPALRIGSGVHKAYEDFFKSGDQGTVGDHLQKQIDVLEAGVLDAGDHQVLAMFKNLREPLDYWRDAFQVEETLETEVPFKFPLIPEIDFVGTPDRVVRIGNSIFHYQHKTASDSTNLPVFLSMARRSLHELIYGWYLEEKWCAPLDAAHLRYLQEPEGRKDWTYGGTIYNIIIKHKYKSKAKATPDKILHAPHEFFMQQMVGIDRGQQDIALKDIEILATQMKETAERYLAGCHIVSDRSRDRGMYGNSNDLYARVMLGELSLDDDRYFEDREERY